MGRLVATAAVGLVTMLALGACGGSDAPNEELREAVMKDLLCNPPGRTIELHNSGLTCEQAGATLLVLSDGMEGPQTVQEPGGEWVCRESAAPGRRSVLKCSQGRRFFTAESTGRAAAKPPTR